MSPYNLRNQSKSPITIPLIESRKKGQKGHKENKGNKVLQEQIKTLQEQIELLQTEKKSSLEKITNLQAQLELLQKENKISTENYRIILETILYYAYYKNCPIAQSIVGYHYYNGIYLPQDYTIACKYFESSAKQNDSSGLNNFGCCYLNGTGIEKNDNEAFKFFKNSAERGHPEAQINLAICYEYGIGTARFYSFAMKYYKLANNQDYTKEQSQKYIENLKQKMEKK